jgi:hypothetical protein
MYKGFQDALVNYNTTTVVELNIVNILLIFAHYYKFPKTPYCSLASYQTAGINMRRHQCLSTM